MKTTDFIPFLMAIVAVFMAYIAYQQYWLNRNKLRFDLYEKRLKQFHVFKEFIFEVMKKTIVEAQKFQEFEKISNECVFLFETDIQQFRKEILENVRDLGAREGEVANLDFYDVSYQESLSSLQQKRDVLQNWFYEQHSSIEDKFHNYLYFKNI